MMELQTIKIIEAYLIHGISCRNIEKIILGIDSPARGGGFKAKKILNDLGITVNEKGALKDIGIDDAINNASGEYLKTLLEYKEYRKTAKDIIPKPIIEASGTKSTKQRKSAYDSKKENYDKETSKHKSSKTTSSYTEETLYKLVQNAEQYEIQIYKNCTNYQKKPIFERVPETKEIWNDIKTFVTSRDDFGKFIRALYMLIFETTKDEDPKNKFENGKPKPIYRLPKEFVRSKTETKHFMDIVDILRHTLGEAHTPSKLKIPEWKISYPDALEELLGSKIEPQSLNEFQKLQIEILKRFENAMKNLLEIVKNELTAPKTLNFLQFQPL
jgi:hypothetical protein